LVTVTFGQTLIRSACISTTRAFGPFSTWPEETLPRTIELSSWRGSSVTNTLGLSCVSAGTAGATTEASAATGVIGAALVFVSAAKEEGARIEKARRRLKHCFIISSPIESSSILAVQWLEVN
jgi:hypothetical protein